jgi:cyclic 2,3-diphosphoglycerate synthetase
VLVLVDGEHYPPVVRAAIDRIGDLVPGAHVVGAALLGGGEKLAGPLEVGVPVVDGATPLQAVAAGLERFRPDVVVDLSDEPVVDARSRMRLASQVLLAGIPYQGADFRLDPPPRPRVATKPTVAVIGTGKRTGKTAVSAHLARTLAAAGNPPVVVAMGRGGPPEPELIDPTSFDLSPAGLVALAASGRHAASDHLEDALMARVATVGTRRCGGGLAGAPVDSTFAAGVELANSRPEGLLVLEGSGAAIPPVHADATLCVVPAGADPELVTGYLGAYRLLLADLIVVTMCEPPFVDSDPGRGSALVDGVRAVAPGAGVVRTVLRPSPLESISGRRVYYVTTAPAAAGSVLTAHLEEQHGCTVVGTSHHLARRPELKADMEAMEEADVLLVELKAAGVDLAARMALAEHMDVVFCDNRVVTVGGDGSFEEMASQVAARAGERFARGAGRSGASAAKVNR